MNKERVLNLVGLAFRASQVSVGVDKLVKDIQKNQIHFVLLATDIERNSKKQIIDKCKFYQVPYCEIIDRQSLGRAIGKSDRVALGIKDDGFAKKIRSLLQK